MSNSNLFMKSAFLRAPLQNGVGRYVCQLQRIVLKFCKSHGGSRGLRDFIEQDLVDFAKQNPSVVVYLKPRRHRSPVVVAEYLNGDKVWMSMHSKTHSEITKWIEVLRTQQGDISGARLRKYQYTDHPSIQGPWTPFTFKDPELNLAQLPDPKFGANNRLPMTATEKLRIMFEKQKIRDEDVKTGE
ncbi:39S ribosomal protein L43, mitochondrial [Maniola jurtina]|uniref:39S ribosomal protein L43, mitochondrial n=1 Tax=Maniola jurtina TaxID=191418 RepID=UPI001E68716D|nr:39S ribosomal protein L43, mitochondrial [Maniola jurtina]XP_045781536.1 39S ribosomal protein L43, mitochondrial [Maniola jurtina]